MRKILFELTKYWAAQSRHGEGVTNFSESSDCTPTVKLPAPGTNQGLGKSRDHNSHGFTTWLASGGVKAGYIRGAADEFGFKAVENSMHIHDLHATILHRMSLDFRYYAE